MRNTNKSSQPSILIALQRIYAGGEETTASIPRLCSTNLCQLRINYCNLHFSKNHKILRPPEEKCRWRHHVISIITLDVNFHRQILWNPSSTHKFQVNETFYWLVRGNTVTAAASIDSLSLSIFLYGSWESHDLILIQQGFGESSRWSIEAGSK